MNRSDFQLRGVGDPRLAVHATSALPAWLWSTDGARVLWANPVGAKLFGAASSAGLADKVFGPADSHRRQVVRLARQLPADGAVRLQRLRGFGARLGALMTCGCARLDFADGTHLSERSAVLVIAMDPTLRTMPLVERLHRLVAGAKVPMAAFAPDGLFVGASEAARSLLGFRDLFEAGLDRARSDALATGRAATPIGIGQMVLQRVGQGADIGLVALIEPATATADRAAAPEVTPVQAPPAMLEDAQPAPADEAPSAIALFDAFTEPAEPPAATNAPAPEPNIPEAADDAPKTPVENQPQAIASPQAAPINAGMVEPTSGQHSSNQQEPPAPRQHPLRFLWQMDEEGRFVLGSDDFIRLMGTHTAAGFGRPWREIAEEFSLDPEGRVTKALESKDTWAGITVNWPADGGEHIPVELAGLPVYDRNRNFAGFRGFGVCRDLDALNRLEALRRFELLVEPPGQGHSAEAVAADAEAEPDAAAETRAKQRRRRSRHPTPSRKPSQSRKPSKTCQSPQARRLHTQPNWTRPWKRLPMSCRSGPPAIPGLRR